MSTEIMFGPKIGDWDEKKKKRNHSNYSSAETGVVTFKNSKIQKKEKNCAYLRIDPINITAEKFSGSEPSMRKL